MGTLTIVAARSAKPSAKPYRLAAGGGLYLEVMPTGAKYWRPKFRHGGKDKRLALGVFPSVTLAEARTQRDAARKLLVPGIDPSAQRKAVKR
ncbi:MAG: Arm DNA-binding domain-containing protein [Rhodanobacteraceae bacterium]